MSSTKSGLPPKNLADIGGKRQPMRYQFEDSKSFESSN